MPGRRLIPLNYKEKSNRELTLLWMKMRATKEILEQSIATGSPRQSKYRQMLAKAEKEFHQLFDKLYPWLENKVIGIRCSKCGAVLGLFCCDRKPNMKMVSVRCAEHPPDDVTYSWFYYTNIVMPDGNKRSFYVGSRFVGGPHTEGDYEDVSVYTICNGDDWVRCNDCAVSGKCQQ